MAHQVPLIGNQKELRVVSLNDQAFPLHAQIPTHRGASIVTAGGLSKLEYAAITLASGMVTTREDQYTADEIAESAVLIARAVLEKCKENKDGPGNQEGDPGRNQTTDRVSASA